MTEAVGSLDYRLLRWSDIPSYLTVVLQGVGKLERATGLDRSAEKMVRSLSRRSILDAPPILPADRPPRRPDLRHGRRKPGRRDRDPAPAAEDRLRRRDGDRGRVPRPRDRLPHPFPPPAGCGAPAPGVAGPGRRQRQRNGHRGLPSRRVSRGGPVHLVRAHGSAPDHTSPLPPGARPATKAELEEVTPRLNEARTPDYRAALPSTPRRLAHNEVLANAFRSRKKTWILRTLSGSPLVLRASLPRTERSRWGSTSPCVVRPPDPGGGGGGS